MSASSMQFFKTRYNGEVPLPVLFWRDTLLVGSAVNFLMMVSAVTYLGNHGTAWIAALIFLAPLPYNFFLVGAIWRTVDRNPSPEGSWAKMASVIWFLIFAVI